MNFVNSEHQKRFQGINSALFDLEQFLSNDPLDMARWLVFQARCRLGEAETVIRVRMKAVEGKETDV
jgi:hypothetical protein